MLIERTKRGAKAVARQMHRAMVLTIDAAADGKIGLRHQRRAKSSDPQDEQQAGERTAHPTIVPGNCLQRRPIQLKISRYFAVAKMQLAAERGFQVAVALS